MTRLSPKNGPSFSLEVEPKSSRTDSKSFVNSSGIIDRGNPLPLYHQLHSLLLAKIESAEWKSGEIIPSEKDLSEQYGVSRITVRQTLQQLVADGYLDRRQGKGTFVTKPKVRHGPQRSFGLTGYLRAHGLKPGWRLLGMTKTKPPRKMVSDLALSDNQPVLEIRRLRLADDEVIGIHTAYVPFPLADRVQADQMVQGDSSLFYLEQLMGVALSESHRIIEAVSASGSEAMLLDVRPGAPLLKIQRTTIGADGIPVEFLRAVYRGDRFEYYVHLEH